MGGGAGEGMGGGAGEGRGGGAGEAHRKAQEEGQEKRIGRRAAEGHKKHR